MQGKLENVFCFVFKLGTLKDPTKSGFCFQEKKKGDYILDRQLDTFTI